MLYEKRQWVIVTSQERPEQVHYTGGTLLQEKFKEYLIKKLIVVHLYRKTNMGQYTKMETVSSVSSFCKDERKKYMPAYRLQYRSASRKAILGAMRRQPSRTRQTREWNRQIGRSRFNAGSGIRESNSHRAYHRYHGTVIVNIIAYVQQNAFFCILCVSSTLLMESRR